MNMNQGMCRPTFLPAFLFLVEKCLNRTVTFTQKSAYISSVQLGEFIQMSLLMGVPSR